MPAIIYTPICVLYVLIITCSFAISFTIFLIAQNSSKIENSARSARFDCIFKFVKYRKMRKTISGVEYKSIKSTRTSALSYAKYREGHLQRIMIQGGFLWRLTSLCFLQWTSLLTTKSRGAKITAAVGAVVL